MVKLYRHPTTGLLKYTYATAPDKNAKCFALEQVASSAARAEFVMLLDGYRLKGYRIETIELDGKNVDRAVRLS